MKAKDFRIGNLVYYHIEDPMDERKEWDEISPIDYDDLRCFETYKDNSEYRPIPLTEEWLLKFGFEEDNYTYIKGVHQKIFSGIMKFEFNESLKNWEFSIGRYNDLTRVEYVHQLQNLYYALTGEELIINQSDCV